MELEENTTIIILMMKAKLHKKLRVFVPSC